MNRNTDLEKIRELAKEYLNMEITEDKIFDERRLCHPFFEGPTYACDTSDSPKGYLDIVGNPADYAIAKATREEMLDAATSPDEIFELFTENWDFIFLNATKDMMSADDLSKVLRLVWNHSEYANNMQRLRRRDALRMFRECNPHILMNDAEREIYQTLPDEVTVYRGVFQGNKQLIRGFSWTMDPEVVKYPLKWWGALRLSSSTGKAYAAKVKKQDVLACFEERSEVVVNPDKLYDIKTYYIWSQAKPTGAQVQPAPPVMPAGGGQEKVLKADWAAQAKLLVYQKILKIERSH